MVLLTKGNSKSRGQSESRSIRYLHSRNVDSWDVITSISRHRYFTLDINQPPISGEWISNFAWFHGSTQFQSPSYYTEVSNSALLSRIPDRDSHSASLMPTLLRRSRRRSASLNALKLFLRVLRETRIGKLPSRNGESISELTAIVRVKITTKLCKILLSTLFDDNREDTHWEEKIERRKPNLEMKLILLRKPQSC